jgi:hypothetical protein
MQTWPVPAEQSSRFPNIEAARQLLPATSFEVSLISLHGAYRQGEAQYPLDGHYENEGEQIPEGATKPTLHKDAWMLPCLNDATHSPRRERLRDPRRDQDLSEYRLHQANMPFTSSCLGLIGAILFEMSLGFDAPKEPR